MTNHEENFTTKPDVNRAPINLGELTPDVSKIGSLISDIIKKLPLRDSLDPQAGEFSPYSEPTNNNGMEFGVIYKGSEEGDARIIREPDGSFGFIKTDKLGISRALNFRNNQLTYTIIEQKKDSDEKKEDSDEPKVRELDYANPADQATISSALKNATAELEEFQKNLPESSEINNTPSTSDADAKELSERTTVEVDTAKEAKTKKDLAEAAISQLIEKAKTELSGDDVPVAPDLPPEKTNKRRWFPWSRSGKG